MRIHPAISIFLGLIVFVIVFQLSQDLDRIVLMFSSFFLAGFIAIYYSKDNKLKYLLPEGLLLLLILTVWSGFNFFNFVYSILFILTLTLTGGILGKLAVEKDGMRSWSFHPLISMILGFIATILIFVFLYNLNPFGVSDFILQQIQRLELIVSLLIGGFIVNYFVQEKKIEYGIYLGLITIIFDLLILYGFHGKGFLETGFNPISILLAIIVYILTPTIGSYLSIKKTKKPKKESV
ncbi:MAG: hypothetical protein ABFC34_05550 [Methanobacterium sp.]